MEIQSANAKIVTKLMFQLLPVQVVLAAVTAVGGLISSFFRKQFHRRQRDECRGFVRPCLYAAYRHQPYAVDRIRELRGRVVRIEHGEDAADGIRLQLAITAQTQDDLHKIPNALHG